MLGGYETAITAHELTSALVAIYTGEIDKEYLRVELVAQDGSRAHVDVKIDGPLMQRSDDLPDKTELIRCRTPQGKEVTFLSPPPAHRAAGFLSAYASVEEGALDV